MKPTMELRWDRRMVNFPSSYEGGPGTAEHRLFLQQAWEQQPERLAVPEDVTSGKAEQVGDVVVVGEWRDVPGQENGLKT